MKKRKCFLRKCMILALFSTSIIMTQRVYANTVTKIEDKMITVSNDVSIEQKIELVTKYMNCKKQNLNYNREIIIDEKTCSAFEYIDNSGSKENYRIFIFEDGTITDYPTSEYKDVKAKDKKSNKAIKAEYTMKKDKIEYKDKKGIVRGIVYFQYPQFKGTTAAIKKINKQLKNESSKFLKSKNAKIIEQIIQLAIQNNIFSNKEEDVWFWKTSCKVSYNKNNIMSIHMKEGWYAGGVYNESHYGFNYNVKTGKKLTIKDVISGNAKEKILKAAKKYCGSDTVAYNIIKDTKSYKFYFSKGKVYLCYGSYELKHGNTCDIISIPGKYK